MEDGGLCVETSTNSKTSGSISAPGLIQKMSLREIWKYDYVNSLVNFLLNIYLMSFAYRVNFFIVNGDEPASG